jgi:hypothetical protein
VPWRLHVYVTPCAVCHGDMLHVHKVGMAGDYKDGEVPGTTRFRIIVVRRLSFSPLYCYRALFVLIQSQWT